MATDFEEFLNSIAAIHPLPEALRVELSACLQREKLPRKTVLLKKGQVCRKLWFVERGFARAFYFKEDKEVTAWFMGEGDFILSVYSFFQQKPSYEVIELLEDASLLSIFYDDLQRIYSIYSEFNAVGRILTEKYYGLSEERLYHLRMHTAQERHHSLLQAHPEIFQRASLKQIDSYLGITPETLSRLRAVR